MNTRFVTTVAVGAALGGLLFGYDTSTMNSAILGVRASLGLSSGQVGLVAAISLLGCAAGAWLAGPMSVRLGRTRIMVITGALVAAGAVGAALGSGVLLVAPCRVVTGLGIGAASAVVPPYITEISPVAMRGRLGSLWQFAIVTGQLLGLLAGFAITAWAGSEVAPLPWGGSAWRWMFAVDAVLALVYALIARALPPSPQDRVRRGGEGVSMSNLRGPRFGLWPVVWVGILLAAFQQLVGINVVKTYSNMLWRAAGIATGTTFLFSILTVVISVLSTIIAIVVIDRVGRRSMLLTGAVVMIVALGALALSFGSTTASASGPSLGHARGVAALIAMNVFAIAFGITWGPVMWIVISELFESRIQSIAVAFCTALNWLTNWAVTRTFPLLADVGLGFAYSLYAVFAVLALLFVWKAVPETRGRTLT
jgi:SP family sugar:H+ symporter-like MFS transporter